MKEQDRNLEYFDDLDKLESLKQEYNCGFWNGNVVIFLL